MKGWAMDTNDNIKEWDICTKCGLNYNYRDVKKK